MSDTHIHFTDEQAFELAFETAEVRARLACAVCAAAVEDHVRLMTDLRETSSADPSVELGDWDSVLLRRKIREAIEHEPAHRPSPWARTLRGWVLPKPIFAGAIAIALAALGGLRLLGDGEPRETTVVREATIPAWTALPALDDDESFEMLSAWTLTDEEIDLAGCSTGLCDSEVAVIESDARLGPDRARDRT